MQFPGCALAPLCSAIALACAAGPASATEPGRMNPSPEGIWKAAVPPRPMPAEFDGFDPVGIAAGARIKADCSLNWINPDDGARYCFSSGTSLEYFLDRPHETIQRARSRWSRMAPAGSH